MKRFLGKEVRKGAVMIGLGTKAIGTVDGVFSGRSDCRQK
jgi:hypothetical protein